MLLNDRAQPPELAEAIVGQHFDFLYRLALSILHRPGDAADAAQEALVDAVLTIDRYEPGTNLRAWLARIVVNKCYGLLRKRTARQRLRSALRFLYSGNSRHGDLSDVLTKQEEVSRLRVALGKLSAKHKVVVSLRYLDGLSIREVAEILDVPEGTVHSRLHYALRTLRGWLIE